MRLIGISSINGKYSDSRAKSYACFVDDLKRCEALGIELYNFQSVKSYTAIGILVLPSVTLLLIIPVPDQLLERPPQMNRLH